MRKQNFILVKNNFSDVFSKWNYLFIAWIVFSGMILLFGSFTNIPYIKGNMGGTYLFFLLASQYLISFLFAIFVPISLYKIFWFNSFSLKNNAVSGLGAFLGILVAGCPACSITVASYIGLASIISFFPWHGLELKLLSLPLLIYANFSLLKDLKGCKVKKVK